MPIPLLTNGIKATEEAKRHRLYPKKVRFPLCIDETPSASARDAINSRRTSWTSAVSGSSYRVKSSVIRSVASKTAKTSATRETSALHA